MNYKPGHYDLEQRTTEFAKRVIRLCKSLPRNSINSRLIDQVVGSAGSIGANYTEANDAIGNKDFVMKVKTARRETKECLHWLILIAEANSHIASRMTDLRNEAIELRNILSSIIIKKT